jgi:hypothetical protein
MYIGAFSLWVCVVGLVSSSDPFLRASVMGWSEPRSRERSEEENRAYRAQFAATVDEDHLDISQTSRGKWRRNVAHIVARWSFTGDLNDAWEDLGGPYMYTSALSGEDVSDATSVLMLAGELAEVADRSLCIFTLPARIEKVCSLLSVAFTESLLIEYPRQEHRSSFSFASNLEFGRSFFQDTFSQRASCMRGPPTCYTSSCFESSD